MSMFAVRRPLAFLAVLGMVATLLFAVVGTASAATVTPSDEALFSACPENANIPDAGFDDVPAASNSFDAINCLAYYAVTAGTSPDTYGPSETVSRTQMAVFLARMAESAGVVLASAPPAAGFTDIAGLSVEAQDAINALAAKGVVSGATATTFNPTGTVSRTQMALFLTRFSDAASAPSHGPGGIQAKNVSGTTTNFTDISSVVAASQKAITRVFHLGVAAGTSATTYGPSETVSRAQMAMFMTRLMGHMNTRPAGVNIQANPTEGDNFRPHAIGDLDYAVAVTLRTPGFLPMANAIIDQWNFTYWENSSLQTPFKPDGRCDTGSLQIQQGDGGSLPCVIETSDIKMDAYGNYEDLRGGFVADTYDLYAWIGIAIGEPFDVDTTGYSMVTVDPSRGADEYEVTLDPMGGVVKFGDAVTWIIQVTKDGGAFAEAGWTFVIDRQTNNSEGGATITMPFRTLTTDTNGRATYTATHTDPNPGSTDENWQVESIWVATANLPPAAPAPMHAMWTDDSPEPTIITVTTPTEYLLATVAANSATATVLDQYGDPMPGVGITLDSDVTYSSLQNVTRTTDGSGRWTEPYTWSDGTVTTSEVITAKVAGISGVSDTVPFVWAILAGDGAGTGVVPAEFANAAANTVVVNTMSTYRQFTWGQNANDLYFLNNVNSTRTAFEAIIVKSGATFKVISYSAAGTTPANWYVYWTP